jgi:hypothetical protein
MKTSLHWVTSADGIAIAVAYRESEPVKIYPLISQYSYFLAAIKKKAINGKRGCAGHI